MTKIEKYFACIVIALAGITIGILDIKRTFFTFGTESDYLNGFVREAQRLLGGQPLLLRFHPPLYSIVLALVQTLTGDWLATGLLISLCSSLIVLGTSFIFFYQLCGRYAGWGAMLGLIGSATFLSYSVLSTSDLFFLALYCTSLLLALMAVRSNSLLLWLSCGVATGCVILTRSNGLTMLVLLVVPWLLLLRWTQKFGNFVRMIVGMALPLVIWGGFAVYSRSQLYPTDNYQNLAVTYFSDRSLWVDAFKAIQGKFHSSMEVLAYDSGHVAKMYLKDLYGMFRAFGSGSLLSFPLYLFVVPGLLFLLLSANKEFIFYLLCVTVAQILIINFKAYESRYFLFLVPLFGAAVGECFRRILDSSRAELAKGLITLLLVLCGLMAGAISVKASWYQSHTQDKELGSVVPVARKLLSECSGLVARKPHVPFYVGCSYLGFPMTLDKLKVLLDTQPHRDSLYVYYGSEEQRRRPELSMLKLPSNQPRWLEVVARDDSGDAWVLFKYKVTH